MADYSYDLDNGDTYIPQFAIKRYIGKELLKEKRKKMIDNKHIDNKKIKVNLVKKEEDRKEIHSRTCFS